MNNKRVRMVERNFLNWEDIADVISIGAVAYIGLSVFISDDVAQYCLEGWKDISDYVTSAYSSLRD